MTKESIDTILRDNPEIQLEILKDRVTDIKRIDRNKNIFLLVILMLLIGLFIYFDYSNKCFMSTLDFKNTTVTNDTDLKTGGNGAITDINKVNISK
jgi:uncharacterized protein YneF (UPF0154 family)